MIPLPINITQRSGESITYLYDTSTLLNQLELISSVSCAEAAKARSRKGKYVELTISKHIRNNTAQYEDYPSNVELKTSAGNIRLLPIKIRITK